MINRISILIGCLAVSFSLFYCNNSDDDCRIITEIDMVEMASVHLPDFHLVQEWSIDSIHTTYTFDVVDSSRIFFSVGLFQSEIDAQDFAMDSRNYSSFRMNEGPHQGVSIGDKFMWNTSQNDPNTLVFIVFTRKNVFFLADAEKYEHIKTLAIKIDNDILNGASYITCIN